MRDTPKRNDNLPLDEQHGVATLETRGTKVGLLPSQQSVRTKMEVLVRKTTTEEYFAGYSCEASGPWDTNRFRAYDFKSTIKALSFITAKQLYGQVEVVHAVDDHIYVVPIPANLPESWERFPRQKRRKG